MSQKGTRATAIGPVEGRKDCSLIVLGIKPNAHECWGTASPLSPGPSVYKDSWKGRQPALVTQSRPPHFCDCHWVKPQRWGLESEEKGHLCGLFTLKLSVQLFMDLLSLWSYIKLLEIKINCVCGVQVTPPCQEAGFASLNKIISSFSISDCLKVRSFVFLFKQWFSTCGFFTEAECKTLQVSQLMRCFNLWHMSIYLYASNDYNFC